jgi:hypothetical protein
MLPKHSRRGAASFVVDEQRTAKYGGALAGRENSYLSTEGQILGHMAQRLATRLT